MSKEQMIFSLVVIILMLAAWVWRLVYMAMKSQFKVGTKVWVESGPVKQKAKITGIIKNKYGDRYQLDSFKKYKGQTIRGKLVARIHQIRLRS